MADLERELLSLTQRLLDSIGSGDWATYSELCDPSLTACEPEAPGQIVDGLDFHRFFFELGGIRGPHRMTMCSPRVRVMGEVALVVYTRLVQRVGTEGKATTIASTETRVWQNQSGRWRHVHFHRATM
jgi:calcium/calmodulin-dependent protein kinase (CaM kinase) II